MVDVIGTETNDSGGSGMMRRRSIAGESRLLSRQRMLIVLLDALGGHSGNTDFQKLLFLLSNHPDGKGIYEFVPYRYGAFSFTACADRRKLMDRGLLVAEETMWQLTAEGRHYAVKKRDHRIEGFMREWADLRGDALIAETYRRYPFHAIRSEIATRVLEGDARALRRIEESRPGRPSAPLYTIGYEGRTLEGYLNVLIAAGVSLLCDVRRLPLSRKYGFSKRVLSDACKSMGIRYEHMPQLGIPSEKRKSLRTQADYDALFREYEKTNLPRQGTALQAIRDWIRSGEHVALTCYERSAQQCHRRCVAEAVQRNAGRRMSVKHL
jgi:hypothetical protein